MSNFETNKGVEVTPETYRGDLDFDDNATGNRITIIGVGGERVIEPASNVVSIIVSDLDQKIEVKRLGYKDVTIDLPRQLCHGCKIQRDAILQKN